MLHYDSSSATLWLFYSESGPQQNRLPSSCPLLTSYPGGTIYAKTSAGSHVHISLALCTVMLYVIDSGATWSTPAVVLPFEAEGQASKMTANLMLVTPNGTWVLPYWAESRTVHAASFDVTMALLTSRQVYDLVPDYSAALISLDQGHTWQSYGHIRNNVTWSATRAMMLIAIASLAQAD